MLMVPFTTTGVGVDRRAAVAEGVSLAMGGAGAEVPELVPSSQAASNRVVISTHTRIRDIDRFTVLPTQDHPKPIVPNSTFNSRL
jgi:hypothetical protein